MKLVLVVLTFYSVSYIIYVGENQEIRISINAKTLRVAALRVFYAVKVA